jgi:DNA-binding LacI/PurR family transcriptional regulator
MPVRIADLAQIRDLDSSTVSRSLRRAPRVRPSTGQPIRQLADRAGTVPYAPDFPPDFP